MEDAERRRIPVLVKADFSVAEGERFLLAPEFDRCVFFNKSAKSSRPKDEMDARRAA